MDNTTNTDQLYTIFDTGSSEILISELFYESFVKNYMAAIDLDDENYSIKEGITYYDCLSSLPPLYYMIEGYWLEISGASLQSEQGFVQVEESDI